MPLPHPALHKRFLCLAALSLAPLAALADQAPAAGAELFPLSQVRLLEGPFLHSQTLDKAYVLSLDADRLLAPFRTEAGLPAKAVKYPNWESTGLDGHTAGHYFTALAQLIADTNDPECKRRLDHCLRELTACQAAAGDGYLGGVPGSRDLWSRVAAGEMKADNFSVNGHWVPWYNLHKTFAGLRDVWLNTGDARARDMLIKLADWCTRVTDRLTGEQLQDMLRCEHGGMAEVLADVYSITGDKRHLDTALRFTHNAVLDPLLRGEDQLTGLHANTQIPKIIGYARIHELGGPAAWREAAAFFWERVAAHRSVAFGGNSVHEHFHPDTNFMPMLESHEGPETCNTYNMLRLTEQLFRTGPSSKLADYYERALFNHILSSQHPGHGGFVYFTPIRPRHYRVYSQPSECFWCCVGSGMESHSKQARFIYASEAGSLLVNLFIPSRLEWKEKGLTLEQHTRFPEESSTQLIIRTDPKVEALTDTPIRVRKPEWIQSDTLECVLNGLPQRLRADSDGYVSLGSAWKDGDHVEIRLPMEPRLELLPDGSPYAALLYGPIMLGATMGTEHLDGLIAGDARMGHSTPGPRLPLDAAPMLVGSPDDITQALHRVKEPGLVFEVSSVIAPAPYRGLRLLPMAQLHDARTMLYWHVIDKEAYPAVVARLKRAEAQAQALEARTIDQVACGEQQPEVEHRLQGEGLRTGARGDRRWRDAASWFSYELRSTHLAPQLLQLELDGADKGRFAVSANGVQLGTIDLEQGKEPGAYTKTFTLPKELAQTNTTLVIRIEGLEGSKAGPVYRLRLLKEATEESPSL